MNKQEFTVIPEGIGSPDFSNLVSSGQVRPGISLKANQVLKQFVITFADAADLFGVPPPYPVPWIKPALPAAGRDHVIDIETGIPVPILVPAGYTLTVIEKEITADQTARVCVYVDELAPGVPAFVAYLSVQPTGSLFDVSSVLGFSTATLDPTAASSHLVDCQVVNAGVGDLHGTFAFIAILEKIR